MIPETTVQQPDGSHREGIPAPLAFARDDGPVRLCTLPETHRLAAPGRPVTIHRLPFEQLTEREAQQRATVERVAALRIDVVICRFALAFGIGATIGILARAAAHAGWL